MPNTSAAERRAAGLKKRTTGDAPEASEFLSAIVTGSAVMPSAAGAFESFSLLDANGEVVDTLDPFAVLLDCEFPSPVEYNEVEVKSVSAWFNVNGTVIAGGDDCKWSGSQNSDRSLHYLGEIGFDFSDAEAVNGCDVRVKLGLNDKGEVVADVCTHAGRGHDEASMSAGAKAMAHMASLT